MGSVAETQGHTFDASATVPAEFISDSREYWVAFDALSGDPGAQAVLHGLFTRKRYPGWLGNQEPMARHLIPREVG